MSSIIKFSRFASDAAGLEKTLRFLQAACQITAVYTFSIKAAAPWLQARTQLALGRRYLRFFKFIDAFRLSARSAGLKWGSDAEVAASTKKTNPDTPAGLMATLEATKWSCLGMYLLLESLTLLHAMGVWESAEAPMVLVEANKFWFYSLCASIMMGILQIYELYVESPPSRPKDNRSKKGNKEEFDRISDGVVAAHRDLKRRRAQGLVKKLVTDACDLFIPGSVVGWVQSTPIIVGVMTLVSTVLSSTDIWARI